MQRYADVLNAKKIPQSQPLPGQVRNSAGGYSYALDDWKRLERFLILGADGPTYYAGDREVKLDNAKVVERCLAADGTRVVVTIMEISKSGRAPKNDPALFALAMALKRGDEKTRRAAAFALSEVARIGTHVFHFAEYVKALGGWGRNTTRAFADWYRTQDPDDLALQAIKYQQRDGWSHRDLLRKSHPVATDSLQDSIFSYMAKKWKPEAGDNIAPEDPLGQIWAFERAKTATVPELMNLIVEYRLPRECVPTEALNVPEVWAALLPHMGLTAMIRNLGKMSSLPGLLTPLSKHTKLICDKLENVDALRGARIHPLSVLVALKTYQHGHGEKSRLSWSPLRQIVDSLDAAFYSAFKAIEPTGKRYLLGLDISGSMDLGEIAGMPGVSPRLASCAMALVTARTERQTHAIAFTTSIHDVDIGRWTTLRGAVAESARLADQMGRTDCAQPMLYAKRRKLAVDCFVIYTDNETWAGNVHPKVALEDYRQATGIPAKLVTVGMVSNGFTIADPNDAGSLDVVGMDSSAPAVIADFCRD